MNALLIKSEYRLSTAQIADGLRLSGLNTLPIQSVQWALTERAENGKPIAHLYLELGDRDLPSSGEQLRFESAWNRHLGGSARLSRLRGILNLDGASANATAGAHYAVETDPEPGWADELARWYADEHLPGLAQVPGCVRARRLMNLDHPPESFACYDLASLDVLASPAWLKVRQTRWSDLCRPHFTNTLRTRFEQTATGLRGI
jgi:hypothetical protein